NLSIRQLDLETGRHVAGADEHGHLTQRNAFFVQLENAVDDEARLLLLVARRDEPWLLAARALGPQVLRVAFQRPRDERVGDVENRLRRPIVLLERNEAGPLKLARKVEDVAKAGAAK